MTYPITLYKFKFKFRAKEKMNLPSFKGSMFRGAFGWTFKKVICVTRQKTCDNCLLKENCGYFQVFETEIAKHELDFLAGVKKSPHPFVIEPPLENKRYYNIGDTFEITTVIFGEAIKYFPFFVFTFQKMGERGIGIKRHKFEMLSVENVSLNGEAREIYDRNAGTLKIDYAKITEKEILANDFETNGELTLEFLLPLRIQRIGKIIKNREELTAELFYEAMIRRVLLVSHLFCGGEAQYPNENLTSKISIKENRLNYVNVMRYSNRQKTKMEFGGFLGKITFEGKLDELTKLARLTEHLHLGKNTVFGLGKFKINNLQKAK